jgi:hypothetical protein
MEHGAGVEISGERDGRVGRLRMTRRQVMGRAGAVATAGAVAWVVPEILIAQPGSAAGLSGNPGANVSGSGGAGVSTPAGGAAAGVGVSASASSSSAAADADARVRGDASARPAGDPTSRQSADSSIDMQRQGEVGPALMASGWDLQHWSPNRG